MADGVESVQFGLPFFRHRFRWLNLLVLAIPVALALKFNRGFVTIVLTVLRHPQVDGIPMRFLLNLQVDCYALPPFKANFLLRGIFFLLPYSFSFLTNIGKKK